MSVTSFSAFWSWFHPMWFPAWLAVQLRLDSVLSSHKPFSGPVFCGTAPLCPAAPGPKAPQQPLKNFFLNYRIIVLQCCDGFCRTDSVMTVYILSPPSFGITVAPASQTVSFMVSKQAETPPSLCQNNIIPQLCHWCPMGSGIQFLEHVCYSYFKVCVLHSISRSSVSRLHYLFLSSWFEAIWISLLSFLGFPGGSAIKNPPAICLHRRLWFDPQVGKILWRRAWWPTPVILAGGSHGQRSLAGYSL